MFVFRVARALEKGKIDYAIVGGFAVALHGAVRGTVDVDIVVKISKANFVAVNKALASIGLQPRLPLDPEELFEFREEFLRKKNLHAWAFVNPSAPSEEVDIILSTDLKGRKVTRKKVGKKDLKVLSIPDLIEMKKRAGRPQDIEDIKALRELQR